MGVSELAAKYDARVKKVDIAFMKHVQKAYEELRNAASVYHSSIEKFKDKEFPAEWGNDRRTVAGIANLINDLFPSL